MYEGVVHPLQIVVLWEKDERLVRGDRHGQEQGGATGNREGESADCNAARKHKYSLNLRSRVNSAFHVYFNPLWHCDNNNKKKMFHIYMN